jgi:peptide/nickel transport system permease protein
LLTFIIKRFLNGFLVIIGVITLVFLLFALLPADPARMVLGQRSDEQSLEMVRRDLGLDKPAWVQYIKYMNDLSPLSIHNVSDNSSFFYMDRDIYPKARKLIKTSDKTALFLKPPYLRRSFQSKERVGQILLNAIPNTFFLALLSILIGSTAGILLGMLAGIRPNSFSDRFLVFMSTLGMALPSFFAAILMGWFFAYILGPFTGLNITGNLTEIDDLTAETRLQLKNIILPALTLGIRPLAVVTQLTRNSLMQVMSQDYIRTARAKGLSEGKVVFRHALKNALNPVVTSVSGWFASLMAGVVFVEYIFGWKGLGNVMVEALNNLDVPVVSGCILIISIIFVLINIGVDIIYSILDPKVRLS